MLPCVLFEDDHLLAVNKPAGLNTHSPSPFAGEGLYEWLRNREPRWAALAIIHRLDKETSGVILFSKTTLANRSLTAQFSERTTHKRYLLLTDRPVPHSPLQVASSLVRAGEKYFSRPVSKSGPVAETRFSPAREALVLPGLLGVRALEAEPLTGRTHQIRVHAADRGFPVLGDKLYGGAAALRLYLHALELALEHPVTGKPITFRAPIPFADDPPLALRNALIEPELTNAFRMIHGGSDGWPGWYVERLGNFMLSQSEAPPGAEQCAALETLVRALGSEGAYHKPLLRRIRPATQSSPRPLFGRVAPAAFEICENEMRFELTFNEGYSTGLFLDQRDNRRKLLTGYAGPGFALPGAGSAALNTFAYTCGFSVCAAKAGLHVSSLDLSKKYLDWGRRNFALNQLEPSGHEFIFGDTFDWLRRLAKKQRRYDLVMLDPPTFSQSKQSGVFRVEKDFGRLVRAALAVLNPGGVLFASTNATSWAAEDFVAAIDAAIRSERRKTRQQLYQPQPPDFPISRAEPGYLKTVWLRIA